MAIPSESGDRLAALNQQLVDVHIWLREELERLHDDIDAYLDGGHLGGGAPPRELRAHCVAFCAALTRHHTGEDASIFPALAERFPQLRPVLDQLARDHDMVTGILRRLGELVAGLTPGTGPQEAQRVRGELDGLTALLESHFRYEERQIAAALDELTDPDLDFLLVAERDAAN